jgi:hypothetical protein
MLATQSVVVATETKKGKSVANRGGWGCSSYCFLKCYFVQKYIKIIFFLFLKIIFGISTSKSFENINK